MSEVHMQDPILIENTDTYAGIESPKLCLLEWMEIITEGIFPSEAKLEQLFDQIEGTP